MGLLASLAYGGADFLGGLVSRRTGVFTVVLVSQASGTLLLIGSLPFLIEGAPTTRSFGWGAAAGVAGAMGVSLLFRGLAASRMSTVAPITGTVAAAVPVIFGLAIGERPSGIALTGVFIAMVAVALVSLGSSEDDAHSATIGSSGIPEALGAGAAFGLFFVLLDRAGEATGLWPLVGARAGSLLFILTAALVTRSALKPPAGTGVAIVVSGVLDVSANLFYLLAAQRGLLAIAAVLTSMYPATTVVLARVVLGERMTRPQLGGLVCAAIGIVLIASP